MTCNFGLTEDTSSDDSHHLTINILKTEVIYLLAKQSSMWDQSSLTPLARMHQPTEPLDLASPFSEEYDLS